MQEKKENKIVVILQPAYLPWIGFFDQLNRCDSFIFFDEAQYTKNSWRNRNRIKTKDGWTWLTVPVHYQFTEQKIKDIKIDNTQKWASRHWNLIKQNYSEAPYFELHQKFFADLYKKEWLWLCDLNLEIINYCATTLKISLNKIVKSSQLTITPTNDVNQKNISYIKKVNGNIFLEGDLGKQIFDEKKFSDAGIKITYHAYKHPPYQQLHKPFIPYLSVIDLLFNEGPNSLNIINN
jgi:hypothetical protein